MNVKRTLVGANSLLGYRMTKIEASTGKYLTIAFGHLETHELSHHHCLQIPLLKERNMGCVQEEARRCSMLPSKASSSQI